MIMHLLEKTGTRQRLAKLYRESKVFRWIINYFGMSAGASAFLFSLGGTCPFCGNPACPIGILGIIIIGACAAGIIAFFINIGKLTKKSFKYLANPTITNSKSRTRNLS